MYKILNRFDGQILAESADSIKAAAEGSGDLSRADLSGADLSGANLNGADLSGADLSWANLSGTRLYGANLAGANLDWACLYGANLARANLSRANLYETGFSGTNLSWASLYGTDLHGTDLARAKLSGTDFDGVIGFSKFRTTPLYGMLDQPGEIVAYKLVAENYTGPFYSGLVYTVGSEVSVEDADTNECESCSYGINLATLDWCLRHCHRENRIMMCSFRREDIAAIPVGSDGRFRVRRCRVIGEKDLKELGL